MDVVLSSAGIALGAEGDDAAIAQDQKSEVVATTLSEMFTKIRDAGHRVIIVMPTPRFADPPTSEDFQTRSSGWSPGTCPNVIALRNPAECGTTRLESQVKADQAATVQLLTTVAEATHATTLDLSAHFCGEGTRTNRGNRWEASHADGVHITVEESAKLGSCLR